MATIASAQGILDTAGLLRESARLGTAFAASGRSHFLVTLAMKRRFGRRIGADPKTERREGVRSVDEQQLPRRISHWAPRSQATTRQPRGERNKLP